MTAPAPLKFCVSCVHHRLTIDGAQHHVCDRPTTDVSLVTGRPKTLDAWCENERGPTGGCGPSGKFFILEGK